MLHNALKVGLLAVGVVFVVAGERVMVSGMGGRLLPSTTLTRAAETPKGSPGTSVVYERVSLNFPREGCSLYVNKGGGVANKTRVGLWSVHTFQWVCGFTAIAVLQRFVCKLQRVCCFPRWG